MLNLYDRDNVQRSLTLLVQPDRSGMLIRDGRSRDRVELVDKASGPEFKVNGATVIPSGK